MTEKEKPPAVSTSNPGVSHETVEILVVPEDSASGHVDVIQGSDPVFKSSLEKLKDAGYLVEVCSTGFLVRRGDVARHLGDAAGLKAMAAACAGSGKPVVSRYAAKQARRSSVAAALVAALIRDAGRGVAHD